MKENDWIAFEIGKLAGNLKININCVHAYSNSLARSPLALFSLWLNCWNELCVYFVLSAMFQQFIHVYLLLIQSESLYVRTHNYYCAAQVLHRKREPKREREGILWMELISRALIWCSQKVAIDQVVFLNWITFNVFKWCFVCGQSANCQWTSD